MFLASGQSKRIFHRLHWLLDLRQSAYMFTSARLEAKKYFTIVTTNASFCLFICAFVFASNSGHFRINDFLLFFTSLLLLNYFLFNLFLFLQKSGGAKAPPAPPSARSMLETPDRERCNQGTCIKVSTLLSRCKSTAFLLG